MGHAVVVFHAGDLGTRQAAEEIARGLAGAGRNDVVVTRPRGLSAARLAEAGIVVLGVPGSARAAQEEFDELAVAVRSGGLQRKTVSIFEVGTAGHCGPGARRLKASLEADDPGLRLAAPGTAVSSFGGRSELPEPEAARCRRFGEHLAGLALAEGRG